MTADSLALFQAAVTVCRRQGWTEHVTGNQAGQPLPQLQAGRSRSCPCVAHSLQVYDPCHHVTGSATQCPSLAYNDLEGIQTNSQAISQQPY